MTYDTINDAVTMAGGEGALLANRYRIVRQLGQGGMGSVWLVEDTQLDDKPFAVKMLPSILVSNKRAYRQLKDEALVAMRLVHPNIVQIRAFEENDGNPFLVMDYVDGQTLDDYLAEHTGTTGVPPVGHGSTGTTGILPVDILRILKPIAAALDYAHAKGVVHRDVKPGNVMIAKDGTPYILDFGIAREIQETMTRVTGKLSSGTLLYMSPEQLMGEQPKPAQDVYSFAAMVYECLKGEPPFSHGQIEFQIMNKRPALPPGGTQLVASVMAGLAKKPEDRPATCAAVLRGSGAPAASVGTVNGSGKSAASPNQQPGGSRSRATAAILVSVVAFLAIVGGFWWKLNRTPRLPAYEASATRETGGVPVQYARDQAVAISDMNVRTADVTNKITTVMTGGKSQKGGIGKKKDVATPKPKPSTGPKDVVAMNAAATMRREAGLQKVKFGLISDEDGFKIRKDALARLFAQAESFWELARWNEAEISFEDYVKECKSLISLDGERRTAVEKRDETQVIRSRAENAEAETYAKEGWNNAVRLWEEATADFGKMRFVEAGLGFMSAAQQFALCADDAVAEKRREQEEAEAAAKAERERARREAEAAEKRRLEERLRIEAEKPKVYLTATLNGVHKSALITRGLAENNKYRTPLTIDVKSPLGSSGEVGVEYFENGVKYVGKGEYVVKKGLQNIEIMLNREIKKYPRPKTLNFCRHCRYSLQGYNTIGQECPKCGENLFGN